MSAVNSSPCRTAQEVAQISQATANTKVLNQKIADLENKLKYYEQTNQRLTAQLNDQQDQVSKEKGKLQKDKDVLTSKLQQNEQQISKLLGENEKLVKTIKKIQVDIQFREENDELRKKIQELEALNKPEKSWSSDAALGLLAQKRREEIQILTNDNQDLKQKNSDLQKKLNNILQENQQLQQIIHQQESASQRLHSQASSIKQDKSNYYCSSQKKNNEPTPSFLVDQINSLKSELSDAKKTIEKLKKPSITKTSTSNNVSPNSKLVQQLKTTNSPQPQKNQELYKSIASGATDNDQIRDLKDKIRQLEFEKDNIAQNIRLECAQDMKQLQDKLRQEQYLQAQMLKEDQKPQQDELKKLNIENQKLQKLITRQEREMQNMEQKLTGLLISQEEIQQSLKKEKQFQDYLKNEKAKLQEQLNDHKDDIIKLSKERQQLKEQLDQLKNDSRVSNRPASQKSEVKKRG